MENAFPRGGSLSLNPLEFRDVVDQATQDTLLSTSKQSSKRRGEGNTGHKKKQKITESSEEKGPIVESLTFRKLSVGQVLLGAVREITDIDLVISLPNQLTGYVSITEISPLLSLLIEKATGDDVENEEEQEIPTLTTFFSIGQLVPVVILEVISSNEKEKTKKRIELSMNPHHVNKNLSREQLLIGLSISSCVISEEDHGYVLDSGIKDTHFFLPSKSLSNNRKFIPGQLVQCTITELDSENRNYQVVLTSNQTSFSPDSVPIIGSIIPGTTVHCQVDRVTENGLIVLVHGLFEASIGLLHLNRTPVASFKPKQKLRATIISVEYESKKIVLSLNANIINFETLSFIHEIGSIQNVIVKRVDSNVGLLAQFENGSEGYIHISRASDTIIKRFNESFNQGTTHKARIMGVDYMDGLYILSLEKKVLAMQFLRHEDIKMGMLVDAEVTKVDANGVLVKICDSISALIPSIHLADIKLTNPGKKFRQGAKIKALVLNVDVERKRVILTCKKSLMQSKFPIVSEFNISNVDMITNGVVKKIDNFGLIISFFGNIQAICLRSDLGYTSFAKISSHNRTNSASWKTEFYLGQIVTCRVVSVDAEERKMRVSLKIQNKVDFESINIGSIHEATVISKESENIIVQITDLNMMAVLPKLHLSDYPTHCEKKFKSLIKGTPLKVVVIEKDTQNSKILVSSKGALIQSREKLSSMNLSVGDIVPAFVNKITESFCTIKTVCGDRLVVMKKNISDKFASSISDFLFVGQTVIAYISTIHEDLRMEASLKLSDISKSAESKTLEFKYLENYLAERDIQNKKSVCSLTVGSIVEGTVSQLLPYGVIVQLENEFKGLMTLAKGSTSMYAINDKVNARVMEIDYMKKIVDLSARLSSDTSVPTAENLFSSVSKDFESVIELIKEDYIIISVPALKNLLGIMCGKTFNDHCDALFTKFKVGQKINAVLLNAPTSENSMPLFAFRISDAPKKSISAAKITFKNAIDSSINSYDDLVESKWIQVKIKAKKDTQINIIIADNIFGRIHVTQIHSDQKDANADMLLSQFKIGSTIQAKIIGFHDSKSHKFLPISHRQEGSKKNIMVELSTRIEDKYLKNVDDIILSQAYFGFVQKIESDAMWIALSHSIQGRVFNLDASHSYEKVMNVSKSFKIGDCVKCRAMKIDGSRNSLDLSLKEAERPLEIGSVTCGRISSIRAESGLVVQLSAHKYGRIHVTDITDTFSENPTGVYTVGQIIECAILQMDEGGKIDLSTRSSKLQKSECIVEDVYVHDINELKAGQKIRGFVKTISDNGCFISLSRSITARAKIAELSDSYIKDFKSLFSVGQLVSGVIMSVNAEQGRVEMTLKESASNPSEGAISLQGLEKGQFVKGTIRKIEKYGVFIKVDNSNLSGLCHISELAPVTPRNASDLYSIGDSVLAKVILIDLEKKRINFSLKVDANDAAAIAGVEDSDSLSVCSSDGSEGEIVDDAMEDIVTERTPLELDGFKWNEETPEQNASDSDEDYDFESKKILKKSKRSKEAEKKRQEKNIEATEKSFLSGDMNPEVGEDFERLILGSPNSSFIWIKYMAFQLQMTEIEKAREIAERAIKQISFREQQEKMNIWIAYLNLENTYGSEETLKKVFERALIMNDSKKIYIQMTSILERSRKKEAAEEVYQSMIKKFNDSCKVWCGYAIFTLRNVSSDAFRQIMKKALLSLPKRKHVKTIIKFAQMEYKAGEAERARTIFEGVLSNYPKRVDLWNIYLDMEIKSNKKESIRRLFERVINMKFSSKKMKFFFKKYLEFEKLYGDNEGVENVKNAAQAYVQKMQE